MFTGSMVRAFFWTKQNGHQKTHQLNQYKIEATWALQALVLSKYSFLKMRMSEKRTSENRMNQGLVVDQLIKQTRQVLKL